MFSYLSPARLRLVSFYILCTWIKNKVKLCWLTSFPTAAFFFFFSTLADAKKIKLKLPHFHVSDTCVSILSDTCVSI